MVAAGNEEANSRKHVCVCIEVTLVQGNEIVWSYKYKLFAARQCLVGETA